MLRACQRLLRPGGRLAFLVITVASGLDPRAHRRAVRAGPSAVAARRPLPRLVADAGFVDVAETDVTSQYATTAKAWLTARERHRAALERLDAAGLADQQRSMAAAVKAIEDGLLERSLVEASKPE